MDSIDIYDSAKLETDDFQKILTFMPSLAHINLRFAGQLKDQVLEYMLDRDLRIKSLQLDAANLVSDAYWRRVFQRFGPQLESLKLSNLDFALDDESVALMCETCRSLRQLKLKQCWKMGDGSLQAISTLPLLEHLSLGYVQEVRLENLLEAISRTGPGLRTLSLEGFTNADDRLLEVIHEKCDSLAKLRFSDNSVCTDQGFVRLFTDWSNPPLEVVDFSSTRDVDNNNPDGPADATGLASQGFVALMDHSGGTIRKLNIASCRHVSRAAFEEVFSENKRYPNLKELDVSFHTALDDYLVGRLFRCCPAIKKLVAFACFNIREVQVPLGVALIGGLKAQDSIVVEGAW